MLRSREKLTEGALLGFVNIGPLLFFTFLNIQKHVILLIIQRFMHEIKNLGLLLSDWNMRLLAI